MSAAGTGILFVISAPSGTGKSTVANRLLAAVEGLDFSVSFTTRRPRGGETDGRDYHFVDRPTFRAMADGGAFLEWASVFGECYGTGIEETRLALANGRDLLLDIDVQGARQVRTGPIPSVGMMILPPDFGTLERRLSGRGSEDEAARQGRLARAREEAEQAAEFDYVVVNDDLERAVAELVAVVRAERRRSARCREEVRRILATFPDSTSST